MTQQLDDAQVIDSHFMGRIFFTVSHIFILLSLQQSNADIRQIIYHFTTARILFPFTSAFN